MKHAEPSNEGNEAPFNMAALFYMSLAKLMDAKDMVAVQGDVVNWYILLRAIYRRASFAFTAAEKVMCQNLFDKIERMRLTDSVANEGLNARLYQAKARAAMPVLDELDRELWRIMDVHKMVFPNIGKGAGMRELYERYGLGGK